ncbi:MAG: hypothetical protein KF811_09560 [Dokdonella sp.]|nr:hypothetical protein [Dokdonella sp.]
MSERSPYAEQPKQQSEQVESIRQPQRRAERNRMAGERKRGDEAAPIALAESRQQSPDRDGDALMQHQVDQVVGERIVAEKSLARPPDQHAHGAVVEAARNVLAKKGFKRIVDESRDRQHAEVIEHEIGAEGRPIDQQG